MPVADAEKEANRQVIGEHTFFIDGPEVGGIERAAVASSDIWDDWPPVSLAENDHILVWWLPEYDEAVPLFLEGRSPGD
jgi:hypothetical protein